MSGGGHLPKEKRPKIINFKVFLAVQKSMNFNYILWLGVWIHFRRSEIMSPRPPLPQKNFFEQQIFGRILHSAHSTMEGIV